MAQRGKHATGFTLVEMAIVLVIIGLILSSILVTGKGSISSAKTGQTISLIKELTEAVVQFKSQHKYFPGDMLVNGEIASVDDNCMSGGDRAGDDNGVVNATESTCVPEHLFKAGLIKVDGPDADGVQTLQSPYGTIRVISRTQSVASALLGTAVGTIGRNVSLYIELMNIPCEVVQEIDRKTDDNNITTGRTQAAKADGSSFGACTPGQIIPLTIVAM